MAVIASFIMHLHDDGNVTCSGVAPNSERTEHVQAVDTVKAAMPGATVESDPWAAAAPTTAPLTGTMAPAATSWPATPQPQPTAAPQAPTCVHGVRRLVPAGVAKSGPRVGQPYGAFWACPADRNDPTKCKSISAG